MHTPVAIAEMTDRLSLAVPPARKPRITRRLKADSAPLSFAQLQMWVVDQMTPGNPGYNLPSAYRLTGPLDIEAIEKSFNEIIRRHEVLRTTFTITEGEPRQVIHPAFSIAVRTIRLDNLPIEDRELQLHALASQESCAPFDLSQLPLIRVVLFKLSNIEHILLINLHHIIADGTSLGLILNELDRHYQVFTGSIPEGLSDLAIQYGDFAAWEREAVAAKDYDREIAYWRRHLSGAPPALELPADFQRPASQSFKGSNAFFEIPRSLIYELEDLGAREGCSLFITLLTAFQVLLNRYSKMDDIVIGSPLGARSAEIRPLIGNFLNMIPLRCDLSGSPTFLQLLRRTRTATLRGFSKAALPFAKIIENLTFPRDPSRNPIFQAMIEVLPTVTSHIGNLQLERFYFDLGFSQFDLSFHAWEEDHGYACRFEYCNEVFKADTIQRMSTNFVQLLHSIVAAPGQRIASVPILSESENAQLADWNRTSQAYPGDQCLHQLFEATAAANPHRIAVECDGQALTYSQLNARANQLANELIARGVSTEHLVGIYLERSTDLVIGLLGILKAGAAYVPLDPLFPPRRLSYMMEDAGIRIVVTQSNLQRDLHSNERDLLCIDAEIANPAAELASNPNIPLHPSNLAYTIYTSGSSGKPKGVSIEHRSLVNCLCAMQREPGFDMSDVMVSVTTISFDIAGLEIFLPLITGGKLILATKDQAMDGSLLARLLDQGRATVLQATPATWKLLVQTSWKADPNFKMLCGGEPLPRELASSLLERGGRLFNMYGPTETTIWSSVKRIEVATGAVPIGPPIANTEFYIVDEEFELVPIGVPGELLIGGDGLARGYLKRPELTAERFVTKRLAGSQKRLYKTGDLAKFRSDGCIEFLGRRDFQVKVRGYRIELEEIERVLASHSSVKDAAVVTWEDENGDKRLVAYYIPLPGEKTDTVGLRKHLRDKLPEYMFPSFFLELPSFPLTPNGKVDRKAFPPPDLSTTNVHSQRVGQLSPVEIRLAEIWQETLRRPVGPEDNFFDLGGHSLLAARMFALIEKKLGVKLPLASLFQFPTVRALANKLEQTVKTSDWSSLVPIRATGSRLPLFLVHGAEGNVLLYRNLAECLGTDQPVYGLQSQGLDSGELAESTIEEIAAKYRNDIQSIQPTGPYYLGGYCLGGTIAFEIAQQFKRAGESVALVAMLETYNIKSRPPVSATESIFHKFQNVCFQVGNCLLSGRDIRFLTEKLRVELSRFKVHCDILRSRLLDRFRNGRVSYVHLRIQEAYHKFQAAYDPVAYDGKVTLFRSGVYYRGFDDPWFGWRDLATQGVEVVELPHYPHGSLNQPFVTALASALAARVNKTLIQDQCCTTLYLGTERLVRGPG